jgi:hypothetical protein
MYYAMAMEFIVRANTCYLLAGHEDEPIASLFFRMIRWADIYNLSQRTSFIRVALVLYYIEQTTLGGEKDGIIEEKYPCTIHP